MHTKYLRWMALWIIVIVFIGVGKAKSGLAEAGSVESLSEQILRLLKDDALRSSLGVAARKDVLLKYSWPLYVQKLEEILKNE